MKPNIFLFFASVSKVEKLESIKNRSVWIFFIVLLAFCIDFRSFGPSRAMGAERFPNSGSWFFLNQAVDLCENSRDLWEDGDAQSALTTLDRAYGLLGKVDEDHDARLARQKEELRFNISKRVMEIHASRQSGSDPIGGIHNEIPMVMNKHIQSEIRLFTKGGEKKFFKRSWRRSGKYSDHIVKKLQAAGMPVELMWVPLIESGFRSNALSQANALGLWQFIRPTGKKYGLKRTRYIDERMDPYKSTDAAIAYLSDLHTIFGDWCMALAAYNCGEGRVLRALKRQGRKYFDNFWDIYERLPQETARYVPRFLATLHIVKNPEKYGLSPPILDDPLDFEIVGVARQISLKNASSFIGTPEKILRELNPSLRRGILPPGNHPLKIPRGKGRILTANLKKIPVTRHGSSDQAFYHKIKSGETLSGIARRYRVSVKKIARANDLSKKRLIVIGKKLKIPGRTEKIFRTYLVKHGDTPFEIAIKHKMSLTRFLRINGLRKSSKIYPGQKVFVV